MKNLLYLLLPFICFGAKAQENDKLKSLVASLDTFRNKVPTEKVHLHLDKPYYSVGDTIWLKAYLVNENNELSGLSKIVYVDLVNDKDSVKASLKLPLTQGLGWGAITLGEGLHEGNYHIKAYTNYMRNFGQEYYFDQSLKIGNALPPTTGSIAASKTQTAAVKHNAIVSDTVSVKFFPEGGDLVNGLLSKVAFKAIGSDGLSREVSGTIVDQGNNPVTTFRSEHAGMGVLLLQPVAGNIYTAVVKLPDSSSKRVPLPLAKEQGYALSVSQNVNNLFVSISASNDLLKSGEVTLVAQAGNAIKYSGKSDLAHGGSAAIIPKSHFPEGIVQFTLFSPQFEPVAERLVFIRNTNNHLNIKVTPDRADYKPHDKVHLDLEVTQNSKPVVGSFSLAVTGEDKVPYAEADETTIFSNLLLSSNLKGYIEHPNYYFTDVNPDKDEQLDNLLLTQGWRRFVWKDLLKNTFPVLTYQPEAGAGISGQVLNGKGKPVPNAKVNILVNEGKGGLLNAVADATGHFSLTNLALAKGTKFNVAATDAAGKGDVTVEIDKEQNNQLSTFKPVPDEQPLTADFTAYLDNSSKRFEEMKKAGLLNSTMLKEVNIEEKVKPKTAKETALLYSSNLGGPGNADQVLTFMDLLPCIGVDNLAECLEGKVTNVHFIKSSKFGWVAYSRGVDKPMLIVIDGVQGRTDVEADDIASIEVLRGGGAASLYGMHAANGVIIINTKKAGVDYTSYEEEQHVPGFTKPPGLQTYTFQGYDLRREFYSPDYDNPATNKQMADLRTTIYWAPNIITDEHGKASVSFFNSDSTGNYRVITEGLDGQGKLGRQVDRYMVK